MLIEEGTVRGTQIRLETKYKKGMAGVFRDEIVKSKRMFNLINANSLEERVVMVDGRGVTTKWLKRFTVWSWESAANLMTSYFCKILLPRFLHIKIHLLEINLNFPGTKKCSTTWRILSRHPLRKSESPCKLTNSKLPDRLMVFLTASWNDLLKRVYFIIDFLLL